MKPIIKVENLSKQYAIGGKKEYYSTFRESLINAARVPLRVIKRRGRENNSTYFWALKDLNFEIMPGEVVGIIGRNGAGKSTLLKVLSRITEPTEGRVELYGRVGSLLEVGTGFHPELTGRENIYLNGAILGMRHEEIDKKFDEIVDFAEIEEFLDTPVKRYSSGMYMRLAFAVAANLDPEILVVDEVLAVGDSSFQKKCLGKMEDVANQGRTVLFVSHNIGAILSLCNSAILLKSGSIALQGTPHTVVASYLQGNEQENNGSYLINTGDEFARLNSIEIIDIKKKRTETLITGVPFGLKINFTILKTGKNPQPNFLFSSEDGTKLFQGIDTKDYKEPNIYTTIVWFEPNILNDGRYVVTVALTTTNPVEIHTSIEISLEILDSPDDKSRGEYRGKMHGYLRPQLIWE